MLKIQLLIIVNSYDQLRVRVRVMSNGNIFFILFKFTVIFNRAVKYHCATRPSSENLTYLALTQNSFNILCVI